MAENLAPACDGTRAINDRPTSTPDRGYARSTRHGPSLYTDAPVFGLCGPHMSGREWALGKYTARSTHPRINLTGSSRPKYRPATPTTFTQPSIVTMRTLLQVTEVILGLA